MEPGGGSGEHGRGTILFLDEVHRFNRAQQDALLPSVEEGLLVFIGATTENPFFEVNAPLLSRSTLWRLEPLSDEELTEVVARGLRAEGAEAEPDAVAALVGLADGDARAVLTTLEVALALAGDRPVTVGGRRAGPPHPPAPLRRGRPLRPGERVHQERARLGSRRRSVLAGPYARVRGGRPVHRPPPGHPGQRGHRRGRPASPGGGRRRCPCRRVRGAPRGTAEPGSGGGASSVARRSRTGSPSPWDAPNRTCAKGPVATYPPICATRTTGARDPSGTARATSTPTTNRAPSRTSSTGRPSWALLGTTSQAIEGTKRWWLNDCGSGEARALVPRSGSVGVRVRRHFGRRCRRCGRRRECHWP